MSTVRRLASGNIAGFVAMVSNLVTQVALVPLYLRFWGASEYGLWLALTTTITLVTLLDNAHLDYLGFECMRQPPGDGAARSRILSDAVPAALAFSLLELLVLIGFLATPLAPRLFGIAGTSPEMTALRWSLAAMMMAWIGFQLPVGLIGRGLTSVGHLAETVWWYVVNGAVQAIMPALAAALGYHLGGAAVAYVAGTIAVQTACALRYRRVALRNGLAPVRPRLAAGLRRLGGGLTLGVSSFLEFLQQTGFRLVLLPFVGAVRLVQFATMRTAANVVQQGLIVLVNPVLPELMRYVSARDQLRTRVTMTALFYTTVLVMCPGFVALQAVVRPLFRMWTRGKVVFDGPVFAALSAAVLVTGLSQASRAIVRGTNMVVAQTAVSAVTGVILLGVTLAVTPVFGLFGAAAGLVLAETMRAAAFFALALRWFRRNDFAYPGRAAIVAIGCTLATMAVIGAMALLPALELVLALLYVPLWLAMNAAFWFALSIDERRFAGDVIARYVPARFQRRAGVIGTVS